LLNNLIRTLGEMGGARIAALYDAIDASDAGFQLHLTKPVNADVLKAAVTQLHQARERPATAH
jgi:hypothetical protein